MADKKTTKTTPKKKPGPKKKAETIKKTTPKRKSAPKKKVLKKEIVENQKVKQERKSKMSSETQSKDNSSILADKIWRLIAMIAFAFIGYFALLLIVILSAMQFVVVLLNDETNNEIKDFTDRLSSFCNQIFSFLSYKSEVMPFPFSNFPDGKE